MPFSLNITTKQLIYKKHRICIEKYNNHKNINIGTEKPFQMLKCYLREMNDEKYHFGI